MEQEPLTNPMDSKNSINLPRRRITRWLRIIAFILLFFFSFLGAVIYLTYSRLLKNKDLKAKMEAKISRMVGLPIGVGDLSIAFPSIMLHKISVGEIGSGTFPWANVETVSIAPDFWELLKGEVQFDSLLVASGAIGFTRDIKGSIILPTELTSAPASEAVKISQPEIGAFPFDSLEFSDIRFHIEDQSLNKKVNLTLHRFEISQSFLGTRLPALLKATVDNLGNVGLEGKITWPDKLAATVKVADVNIAYIKELFPAAQGIPAEISSPTLNVSFSINRKGKAEVTNLDFKIDPGISISGKAKIDSFSPVQGTISFSVPPLRLPALFALAKPFLPAEAKGMDISHGEISLGGNIGIAGGSIHKPEMWIRPQNVTVNMPQIPMPITDVSSEISLKAGKLTWQNMGFSLAGTNLQSKSGSIDLEKNYIGFADFSLRSEIAKLTKALNSFLPADSQQYQPQGTVDGIGIITIKGKDSVLNGNVTLSKIQVVPPQTGLPIKVTSGSAEFSNFGLETGALIVKDLNGETLGGSVKVQGELKNPLSPKFDFEASGQVDLAVLHKELPVENELFKKKSKLSGKAKIFAHLKGTKEKPDLSSQVSLHDVDFFIPTIGLEVEKVNGNAEATMDEIKINTLQALIGGGIVSVQGKMESIVSKPRLALTGALKGGDLGKVTAFLARNFSTFPKELELSGKTDLSMKVTGSATEPDVTGNGELRKIRLVHPAVMRPLENIHGPVKFTNSTLSVNGVKVSWGSSTAEINGKIDNLSKFNLGLQYSIKPLDLTDVGQFFLATSGYALDGKGTGNGSISGPIDGFVLQANAVVPQGSMQASVSKENKSTFKFPFSNLNAACTFSKGVLTVNSAKARVFKGTIKSSGKVFVTETPIRFDFKSNGDQLLVEEFLAINSSVKKALQGGIDVSFTANGNTTGLNSLNGNSYIRMKKGKYQSPPMISQIFALLQASHLASGDIQNIAGNFIFRNGKMNSDDLLMTSPYGNVKYKGYVGLDTSLKGTMNVTFTRQACTTSSVLQKLAAGKDQLNLSVGVKGSLLSPSIDLGLEKLLKDAAKKQAKDLISTALLGGKNAKTASATQALIKNPGKAIKNEFNNLLKGVMKPKQENTASQTSPTPTKQEVASSTPKPEEKKTVKKELKKIEKNLKNLFKF